MRGFIPRLSMSLIIKWLISLIAQLCSCQQKQGECVGNKQWKSQRHQHLSSYMHYISSPSKAWQRIKSGCLVSVKAFPPISFSNFFPLHSFPILLMDFGPSKQRLFSTQTQFNVLNYWLGFSKRQLRALFLTAGREAEDGCLTVFHVETHGTHFCPLPLILLWAEDHCTVKLLDGRMYFWTDLKVNLMHNSLLVLFLSPAIHSVNQFLIHHCKASDMKKI